MRPTQLTKTRCGLAARITLIAGFPGSNNGRPAYDMSCAATPGSATRTHRSTCKARRPRSNSGASRSCSRKASWCGQRREHAAPVHGAAALRQADRNARVPALRVVLSEANRRTPAPASMRIAPREVIVARKASPRRSATGSSGCAQIRRWLRTSQAPGRLVVGHLVGQKREDIGGVAHGRISSDVPAASMAFRSRERPGDRGHRRLDLVRRVIAAESKAQALSAHVGDDVGALSRSWIVARSPARRWGNVRARSRPRPG